MKARVLFGIKNRFTLLLESGEEIQAELKGKRLSFNDPEYSLEYSPLVAGDWVLVKGDPYQIYERLPRKSEFGRWNRERTLQQTIAGNIDQIVLVASCQDPPFLPQFVDRLLVRARFHEIEEVLLVFNKWDKRDETLGKNSDTPALLSLYESLEYRTIKTVALTGEGVEDLRSALDGKSSLFMGQSGVGKSSLLNRLLPEPVQKIGEISLRYKRGRHTTNFARAFPLSEKTLYIDTPGIKTVLLEDLSPQDIQRGFPEIDQRASECRFRQCTHIHEPKCAVKRGLSEGSISEERYNSYLSLLQDV